MRAVERIGPSRRSALLVGAAIGGALLAAPESASAAVPRTVDVRSFGADPAGARDSGPAFRNAIAALQGRGGVVRIPFGRYRIRATAAAAFIELTAGVQLRGPSTGHRPVIEVESDDQSGYREFLRVTGSRVTIDRLRVRRSGDFPAVLINAARGSSLTISFTEVNGRVTARSKQYCHGLQLGLWHGTQRHIRIDRSMFENLSSCILTTNDCRGTFDDLQVIRSRMQSVDFNFPKAKATGVKVIGNIIDGRGSRSFGVSLANVQGAVVTGNVIRNVPNEAIHIEDYSSGVLIARNALSNSASSGTDTAALIEIIAGAKNVTIQDNSLTGRTSTTTRLTNFIAAQPGGTGLTPGGRPTVAPSNVQIYDNVMRAGTDTAIDGVFLYEVTSARTARNRFIGTGAGKGATFAGSDRVAIRALGGSDLHFSDNSVSGWRLGLDASGSGAGTFQANAVAQCRSFRTAVTGGLEVSGNAVDL